MPTYALSHGRVHIGKLKRGRTEGTASVEVSKTGDPEGVGCGQARTAEMVRTAARHGCHAVHNDVAQLQQHDHDVPYVVQRSCSVANLDSPPETADVGVLSEVFEETADVSSRIVVGVHIDGGEDLGTRCGQPDARDERAGRKKSQEFIFTTW